MIMRSLFTLVVFLASALQTIQACNSGEPLVVKVVAVYNNPPSSSSLSPPLYQAASALSLSCEVERVNDEVGLLYQWSTTSSSYCFVRGVTTRIASTNCLHSYDSGEHTCTVYDELGCTGNASITVKVAGAGIYVESTNKILPNNGLIITTSLGKIPSFCCLSGSSKSRVGRLIDPLGNDITFSTDPFVVRQGDFHDPGTLYIRSLREFEEADSGVYICRTPDEDGNMLEVNFGLYLHDDATTPVISDFVFSLTDTPFTFSYLSSFSPPTEVIWEVNGERIYFNDSYSDYHFFQTLVNYTTSTYNNTLTFNGTNEDVIGEYSCTVVNSLGSSNTLTKTVKAMELSGHEDPFIVGLSRRMNCTTYLNVTRMEWLLVGAVDPVKERDDGGQELTKTLKPNDTSLDGAMFTCRVTTTKGQKFEETVTVKVKELEHHSVSITGHPNPLLAGGNYSLICVVTSDFAPTVQWLDPNTNEVITTTGTSVTTDNPVTNGNTTELVLNFDPIHTSHGGIYACISTVGETGSYRRETRYIRVQITTTSVNIVRSPSTQTVFTMDQLDITCTTILSPYVDTPVQVTHYWVGPSGAVTSDNGTTVSPVTGSDLQYMSTLSFSSLRLSDSGIYTCTSSVNAIDSLSVSIISSAMKSSFTSFEAAFRVIIEITTNPDHDPDYSPPNYRVTTSVTLRCVAVGITGYVFYSWSSTCQNSCFAYSVNSQTISESRLSPRDGGVHTCTASDEEGNTETKSIIMNIVGIGIYVTYSLGTGTSVNSLTSQPPNSYAIVDTNTANRCSYIRFEMYCCSNSTSYIPNFSYPGHDGSIRFNSYAGSSTYAGCYRLQFYYNYRDYFYLNYPGIYTCSYVDTRGNYIAMNIGLYPEEFNTPPSIYSLYRNHNYHNSLVRLTSQTRNAPPTNITWFKNDEVLDIDGNVAKMTVSLNDRWSSYFDIFLDICDSPDDIVGVYTFQVANEFGMSSAGIVIEDFGLRMWCSSSEFIIGNRVECVCSSRLDPILIEWYLGSTSIRQSYYSTSSSITIPVTMDNVGSVYTCQVTTNCGMQKEMVIVNTTVPDNWAYVYIDSRKDALHGSEYTLLCTVMAINGMTLPPSIVWVGPDGTVLVSEENVTVGEVETQGTVSTSSLTFNPVLSSQGGRYTCIVTVDVPWMLDQPDQLFDTFNMLVTTQAMFQLKLYPLPLCTTWQHSMAYDLEYSIMRELMKTVRKHCNCYFSYSSIHSGEFSCLSTICHSNCSHTPVTYRAIINGRSDLLTADQLMNVLREWHESTNTLLLYNKIRLKLANSKECPLAIDSFDEEEC